MAVTTLTLYRIDEWDGGDRHYPSNYYFRDEADAEEVAGAYNMVTKVVMSISDTATDYTLAKEETLREKALNKLSNEEKRVLGL